MKNLPIILIIILSINCYSQNESFTVKETVFRIGETGEFKPLGSNDIFTKFILKKNYVELHTSQKEYTTVTYDEMEKVRKKNGKYEYYFHLKDWLVSLIFAPYPYSDSEPVFIGALVVAPGIDKNRPNTLTTFQMILDYY